MRWKNEGTRRPKLHLCKNRLVVVVVVVVVVVDICLRLSVSASVDLCVKNSVRHH